MTGPAALLKKLAARTIAIAAVIALLGFYPAYIGVAHSMCGIIKGKVVRYP